jgi:hypothetical protein
MSNLIQGKNAVMQKKVGSSFFSIACAKSCTFSYQNELIPKTGPNSGLFRDSRARIGTCQATFNGVLRSDNGLTYVSGFHFLEEAVRRTKGDYRILFTDNDGGLKVINITGLLDVVNINGNAVGFYSEFDLSIIGTSFSIATSTPPPGGVAPIYSDWWSTTPGSTILDILSIPSDNNGDVVPGNALIYAVWRDARIWNVILVGNADISSEASVL